MRFAYADPPYFGTSKFGANHHYGDIHPRAAVFDLLETHEKLVADLCSRFPDGWAMSSSSTSLRTLLPLCPEGVRVAAWVKGWCSYKPGVSPKYAWEPVLFLGGRAQREVLTRDWFMASASTGQAMHGAKPAAFCSWILNLLGYEQGDEVVDLFPGTGVMGRVLAQGLLFGELEDRAATSGI